MPEADNRTQEGLAPLLPREHLWRDRLANTIAVLSMATLMVYVAFITVNVIARYIFNSPLHWIPDLGELLVPFALSLSFPAAAMQGAHLSIQFLGNWLGSAVFRALELLARVITAALLAVITWKVTEYTFELYETGRTTVQFGISIWPIWAGVSLGFALSVPGMFFSPLTTPSGTVE